MSNIRLSKVCKQLNIGVDRAVEYLASKGHEVERNPNTKISEEQQQLLMDGFQLDMTKKEKSEQVSLQKKQEKEEMKAVREADVEDEKKDSVIKARTTLAGPKVVARINLNKPKAVTPTPQTSAKKLDEAPKVEPEPTKEELPVEAPTKQETPVVEDKPVVPVAEAKPAQATVEVPKSEEKPEQPAAPEAQAPAPSPKTDAPMVKPVEEVITPEASKTVAPEKTPEPAPEVIPEVKAPAAAKEVEAPISAEPQAPIASEPPVNDNVIKTTYQKLEGPKFTGDKIDLTQFERPKKKKVASSAAPAKDDKKKRKRKRIATDPAKPDPRKPQQGQQGNKPGARPKVAPKAELTDEDIQKQIKETLEKLTGNKKSKGSKLRKAKREERREKVAFDELQKEQDTKILKVTEFVTVSELATMMDVPINKLIGTLMGLGIMATMNQRLDAEVLKLVTEEFGFDVDFVDSDVTEAVQMEEDKPEDLIHRPPIVTVMGHVDHGKTSLLDYIRNTNVIAGEAGGITQHIGAYSVQLEEGETITFLDTPGHEAFTAMRARGAQVTDVAIIVVAADDDVMPQTKEAIAHAQAANVPIVFAINKIDKENANPEKVKERLAGMNLLVDSWGGPISSQEVSAKKGINIKELLEKVLLEAEVMELKANPNRLASGTVIEASLDKGRGYLTTILVQNGTLKIGDYLLAGQCSGKVKAMVDERGQRITEAGPSKPVSILGLDGAPQAGDGFVVMDDEREAKNIAARRMQLQREQSVRAQKNLTLEEIGRRLALGDFKELNLILKGDVDGSVEALSDALQKLSTDEIQVNIVHKAVGQISESDVLLAAASNAIIVGFQVRPSASSRRVAEKENVEIRMYSIIYDAINEIKDAMEGMLSPELKEEITCNIEVRETFKITKVGTIAGCMVLDGNVTRNTRVRIIRDGVVIYTGELGSLKRFKDDVKEVAKGYECGLNIKNFNDIKVGDIIEGFKEVEVRKTL
jgi:translation initiation factor IF-2